MINQDNPPNVKLRLLGKRGRDGRTYNLPFVSEVAILVVGDFDHALGDRDIIVEKQSGKLQRISELHPSYLALQYPLLFSYGEDGYTEFIGFSDSSTSTSSSRKRVIPKEWIGYPNLFITFTCNPKWPEIQRFVRSRGLKSDDRPDIVSRMFKVKLDVIYTIEFHKRGLPHAHILLFLSNEDKQPYQRRIDEIISSEIPDPLIDPYYYECVKELMMHGPCGVYLMMKDLLQSVGHQKKVLVRVTVLPPPPLQSVGHHKFVLKDGVSLDNRYVVPHNRFLLVKYGGHINVEWCNQSRSIKYLFKYVHKGYDRVTTSFFQSGVDGAEKNLDEVSLYYDCRYVSACEAAWRTFGFEIQYKDPSVERFSFHLPNKQHVIFYEADSLDNVLNRRTVHESKFLGWMEANKLYFEGRNLTYGEFPTKFVWKKDHWQPRKQRYSVGRLFYVALGSGDIDSCFALRLLDDDKEYIDGIVEASFWSSAHSLRLLFRKLRNRPDLVLSDDEIQNIVLTDVEKLLMNVGKSLHDYHDSMCNIKQGTDLAELIIRSKLIIWDEAPMIHKHCIEAVDRTLRDIFRVCSESSMHKPFGGKTIVFGSDFRQILPIVPKGSRQNIVNATINSSYLWSSCTILRLTRNMRLLSVEKPDEAFKLKKFSSWVASIGDGVVGGPNDGGVVIDLPSDIVLSNSGDPLKTIVENIYPSYMDPEKLSNCLHDRTILAPTLDVVDEVNQFMISMDQSQGRVYLSSDSISNSDSTSKGSAEIHSVEFLNNLKGSGTPNHELMLKVETPVMLLRNIDHSNGLCNGTRLIITRLGDYVLEARVLGVIILVIRF
ncbi:uncharacterized protein LOC121757585 [Salvia splendens]|uniref:uncharacterized protein LOC121757585 n=1 Tax=Salvia splendens TaxID=180675 RepID=UPI001C26909F|nr:uncharacterized protein LOC121757585 [Salvia splendens]